MFVTAATHKGVSCSYAAWDRQRRRRATTVVIETDGSAQNNTTKLEVTRKKKAIIDISRVGKQENKFK
ncbi:hypothetical protein GUJ93_ZPchr0013g34162 [Zizania palustris]|uniref:Uncharacterized protein n=1 Tax=Zizania palustris TaxID=103762 RepID=A0A8J5WZB2_ZIZPA|nr:hypothetical protein GUJ93_ZPchr0013g34162 [Zizania palustris]